MEGKERMNILIFSWRGPGHPNAGGAEVSTHEHAKAWVKAGHKITLFTSSFPNAKSKEIIDGVEIIRSGNQIFGVHISGFIWYLFKERPSFDLVIDQFHGIPFFTPFFVSTKKLAFIHETAKGVWSLNEFMFPFNFLVSFIGNFFEPLVFKLYKNIPFMTVSNSTKKDLNSLGINNVVVVHNGVTVPKISSRKEKISTVTYLGALTKDKGIQIALDAFRIVKDKIGDIQFWVIGKGEAEAKDVKFWGYVSEKEKFDLLSRSHLLVNPSAKEGWGIVVMEAAAMGTPTVGFDVAGLRDSIISGKTGFLVTKKTVEALAEKICELLEDNKNLEKMSRESILWSKNFTWEKSTKESLELIKKLV